MEGRKKLEHIRYDASRLEWLGKTISKIATEVSVLLIIYHRNRFSKFRRETQEVILSTLEPNQRRLVHEIR
jgi:hypothetical protein